MVQEKKSTDRVRYVVGARKIAPENRDVARAVMTAENNYAGFADVIGADDDPTVPEGAPVAYAVELTEDEAERFRAASNCRYLEVDQQRRPAVVDVQPLNEPNAEQFIPPDSTMRYMWVSPSTETTHHGRNIPVAVLDGGTTAIVKGRFGWQLVAHRNFAGPDQSPDRITVDHGCMVSPLCVPPDGQLVEAVVFSDQGWAYDSWIAAAIRWAADAGAKIINFSGGGGGPAAVYADALNYASALGAVVVVSAGNSAEPYLEWPSRYSETHSNTFSSIAFASAAAKSTNRSRSESKPKWPSSCAVVKRCLT